jgi:chromosome segregation ATPase
VTDFDVPPDDGSAQLPEDIAPPRKEASAWWLGGLVVGVLALVGLLALLVVGWHVWSLEPERSALQREQASWHDLSESRMQALESLLAERQQRLADAEGRCTTEAERLVALEAQSKSRQQTLRGREANQLAELERLQQLTTAQQQKSSSVGTTLAATEGRYEKTKAALEKATAEHEKVDRDRKQAETVTKEAKETKAALDAEMADLRGQVDEWKKTKLQLATDLSAARTALSEAKRGERDAARSKAELSFVTEQLTESKNALKDLETQIEGRRKTAADLRGRADTAATELQNSKAEHGKVAQALATAKSQRDAATTELLKLREQVDALGKQRDADQLVAETNRKEAQTSTTKLRKVETQLAENQGMLGDAERSLATLIARIEAGKVRQSEIEEATQGLEQAKAAAEVAERAQRSAENEAVKAKRELASLNKDVAELQKTSAELSGTLGSLKARRDALTSDVRTLQKAHAALETTQQQLALAKSALGKNRVLRTAEEEAIDTLKGKRTRLEDELKRMQAQRDKAEAETRALQNRLLAPDAKEDN